MLARMDRDRLRDRALQVAARYGAPVLLAAVALVQSVQVQRLDLSPWKGGGFGMFSTVDTPKARFLRLYLVIDRGEVPVPVPAELARPILEVQTLPTERRVDRLARQFAAATWAVPDLPRIDLERVAEVSQSLAEELGPLAPGAGTPVIAPVPLLLYADEEVPAGFTRVDVRAVWVELWRYRFEPETTRLEVERLLEARAKASALTGRRAGG